MSASAERLVDQLELLDRHLWVDAELHRDWLRTQSSAAMTLATAICDAVPPVRYSISSAQTCLNACGFGADSTRTTG